MDTSRNRSILKKVGWPSRSEPRVRVQSLLQASNEDSLSLHTPLSSSVITTVRNYLESQTKGCRQHGHGCLDLLCFLSSQEILQGSWKQWEQSGFTTGPNILHMSEGIRRHMEQIQ
jgi:hypothetical protein